MICSLPSTWILQIFEGFHPVHSRLYFRSPRPHSVRPLQPQSLLCLASSHLASSSSSFPYFSHHSSTPFFSPQFWCGYPAILQAVHYSIHPGIQQRPHPIIYESRTNYQTGISLSKVEMRPVENAWNVIPPSLSGISGSGLKSRYFLSRKSPYGNH
jgi:hypothetical protein